MGFFYLRSTSANTCFKISNPEDATKLAGGYPYRRFPYSRTNTPRLHRQQTACCGCLARSGRVGLLQRGDSRSSPFAGWVNGRIFWKWGIYCAVLGYAAVATVRPGTTIVHGWAADENAAPGVAVLGQRLHPASASPVERWNTFLSKNTIQDAGWDGQRKSRAITFYWLWFSDSKCDLDSRCRSWQVAPAQFAGKRPARSAHLSRCHTYNAALGGHLVGG